MPDIKIIKKGRAGRNLVNFKTNASPAKRNMPAPLPPKPAKAPLRVPKPKPAKVTPKVNTNFKQQREFNLHFNSNMKSPEDLNR